MKTIDFSYFIERYNAGEMDEAEMQWFRKELRENQKLRKEVELRNKTDDILKNQDLMNLRNKLNAIEKQRAVTMPVRRNRQPVIKYAAVIAALIILGSLALLTNKRQSTDELIDRYYKPYETASASRSAEFINNSDYNLAVEYYNIRDYRNAAIYFSRVLEKDPDNMHSTLLNGISNFEIQNYSEAKRSFSKVIDNNDNYYIDHAQWYLAMCYIRTDERSKAVQELTLIKNSNTIYTKPARKLLRNLR
ncbi:MAG: tetratricopeptide repeat protein [Bacteroidota bacterium]|nr:tetratricopeptide repeat protein [Bacteroidota bacterium]